MEHRFQTIIGSLQFVLVIAGWLIVRFGVRGLDKMFVPNLAVDPLASVRLISGFGWLLLAIPLIWILLTIRGQASDFAWATQRFTMITGFVVLLGLFTLFLWATQHVASVAFGLET